MTAPLKGMTWPVEELSGGRTRQSVVALALAALIQCFDWVRIGDELVDMSEGQGLTMPKSKPLEAMCRPREMMVNTFFFSIGNLWGKVVKLDELTEQLIAFDKGRIFIVTDFLDCINEVIHIKDPDASIGSVVEESAPIMDKEIHQCLKEVDPAASILDGFFLEGETLANYVSPLEPNSIGSRSMDSLSTCDSLVGKSREAIDSFKDIAGERQLNLFRNSRDGYPSLDNSIGESNCLAAVGVGMDSVEGIEQERIQLCISLGSGEVINNNTVEPTDDIPFDQPDANHLSPEEVRSLLKNLLRNSQNNFTKVEMKLRLSELAFNIVVRIVSGKRYFGAELEDSKEAREFRLIIRVIFYLSAASNSGDFVPFLRWIDFAKVEKKALRIQKKMDAFLQGLIDETQSEDKQVSEQKGGKTNSMIDSMLGLQDSDPEYYSDEIIKGIVMTMIGAGTNTSSVTIEWAMLLLLNHAKVLDKARAELDAIVGDKRLVDELDLSKLPYPQNIINETLRLFPAAPLLAPHESSDNCTMKRSDVARERFEVGENQAYGLIPFGIGRRSCPGAGLANRVVGLALAALIQCFDWMKIGDELVGMSEGKGLTMPKSKPLEAMCRP
ncbi:hypothetical protein Vadar_006918 [Vaccinium darrowii]|uniref:Uncharacterized protein n=1 Tax=Vaccinium darrowii TaxID=229202 RepID=A0ACB7Y5N6_9ERIC|nr:hypothetical protein Vadar_006918 [Vaccinium darrowii]